MRALLSAISLLIVFTCSAQIPNGGFENWYNSGNFMEPEDWWTPNMVTWQLGATLSAEEGTPGAVGDSFIKVTSRTAGSIVEVGRITCGNEFTGQPGFPFTQRPTSFNGMYQYHPQGNDQGQIYMTLTKYDPQQMGPVPVAHAVFNVPGPVTSWLPFTQEFIYFSDDIPDSARVYVVASMDTPVNGTSIWVDDLHVEGSVGLIEQAPASDLQLFPSPVHDRMQVRSDSQLRSITILSLHGSRLRSMQISGTRAMIDLADLAPGVYFALIESSNGIVMRRFGKE